MVQQLYRDSVDRALRAAAWGIELLARGVGAAARMLPDPDPGEAVRSRKAVGGHGLAAQRSDER